VHSACALCRTLASRPRTCGVPQDRYCCADLARSGTTTKQPLSAPPWLTAPSLQQGSKLRVNPRWSLTPRSTPTRYGRRCKPGPRHMVHHRVPGLQRLPTRAALPRTLGLHSSSCLWPARFRSSATSAALHLGAPRFVAPSAITRFGNAFGALGVQSQLWPALRACRPLTLVRLRQHFSAPRLRFTRSSLRAAPRTSLALATPRCSQASLHHHGASANALHVARFGHTGRPNPSVNADPLRQAL
jgi:hypothetical protein